MAEKKTKSKADHKNNLTDKNPIFKGHEHASHTAKHYGFHPFSGLQVEKQDLVKAKNFKDSKKTAFNDKDSLLSFDKLLEEKIAIMRMYVEKQMADIHQPPMISFSGPISGNPHASDKTKLKTFNLDIVANPKSIADALVIETAFVILKEQIDADSELMIEINSIGDKESFQKFTKDLIVFSKKRAPDMPSSIRQAFKKDPFTLYSCKDEECLAIQEEAPKPMSYLSEESRDHFREVLEYIESLSIPYTINHSLIGSRHYSSGTIFQIVKVPKAGKGPKDGKIKREVLAIGERYNNVSKKAWNKKEVPAVGVTMLIDEKAIKNLPPKQIILEEAKFYFIQLGYDAKLKSLSIIEMLRVANIPVHQSLSRDKITSQLAAAEKLNVPYIILLGQKEAIENSVTIRHVQTRVQETVKLHELVDYIKKLLK
jgi:histidyl-tRNA synthetase